MSQELKKIELLKDRAKMLFTLRNYFLEKNILEVDVPALSSFPTIDNNIDVLEVNSPNINLYLHSSPEYGMKKLLSLGIGDIYQISHVFRANEKGNLHNLEFMMIEWYRTDISYEDFITEVVQFFHLFFGKIKSSTLTYKEAFEKFSNIDPFSIESEDLIDCLTKNHIDFSKDRIWEKKELLELIYSHLIEPNLGKGELLILNDYPATDAALAKTYIKDGLNLAKRFEIYYQGIELANGYEELKDPIELLMRFNEINKGRKTPYPIDTALIESHKKGLPDCCGVAAGFDRALMLRNKKSSIQDVVPSASFAL